jgi:capsular polysaccharide transport system permease protein
LNAVLIQARTLRALIVRELMMRYGREGGGFVWVIVEPMMLCIGVTTLWVLMKPPYEKGILVAAIVFTGYMPLTLWRHLTNPGVHALRNNRLLFYHASISSLDVFFSRQILEFMATSSAFIVVYMSLLSLGYVDHVYDWSILICAWITFAYISVAFSLLFCTVTEFFEWSDKLVQPFQYLLIPISGSFFILDWLPNYTHGLLLLNPLLHIYEAMRAGFIGPTLTTYGTLTYPIVWATIVFAIGVVGLNYARKKVFV